MLNKPLFSFRTPLVIVCLVLLPVIGLFAQTKILNARKTGATRIEVSFKNSPPLLLDFYSATIFRMFRDPSGGDVRDPEAPNPVNILADNARRPVGALELHADNEVVRINTGKIILQFRKENGLFKVTDRVSGNILLEQAEPVYYGGQQTLLKLRASADEYFYGGGVQNGRFSHRGNVIAIENQNSWTDGGVASPTPFFWSTKGYGLLWHTFRKGMYDFRAVGSEVISVGHETGYLDVFFMAGNTPENLLNSFYQLTGRPVLLPKFGFYQGHLNAYNRDFWKQDQKGILFEDGKRYSESQKDNGGIKESLNGELGNYQFSARAVIDRYKRNDMPLGWLLPNDGYGAGYGQTSSLDSNILNLKSLGDYARGQGVEIGLWTQSDLYPKPNLSAVLQRDIIKETRDAGVRVLKTDVAWVGSGYSFGLRGISDVAKLTPVYGGGSRPFIITLDGWAGTQRYAGVWTGDQTGGNWEYIRFHIPTYIGAGLSGQPNISSDMDGIFGGRNPVVNTRDFQWKTFTPMQLNMDGWGANEKYPQALGEPVASINRHYLKWKSALLPYTYSIAKEAMNGLPMVRAIFLEERNSYTQGVGTQYEFMYGPNFLIAPVYRQIRADSLGNDVRHNIYLPKGTWFDYLTGDAYEGGQVINSFDAPLWKLPVFVKAGAIIPYTSASNNVKEIDPSKRYYEIYIGKSGSFTEYDDDGRTERYKQGEGVQTFIETNIKGGKAEVIVHAAKGNYPGFVRKKATEFLVNLTAPPENVSVKMGGKEVKLTRQLIKPGDTQRSNTFTYIEAPDINLFSTPGSGFAKQKMIRNPQLRVRLAPSDVTRSDIVLRIEGAVFRPGKAYLKKEGTLELPEAAGAVTDTAPYSLSPSWKKIANADFYEVMFDGMRYTLIQDTSFLFEGLVPDSIYHFQLRAVNSKGYSPWLRFQRKTAADPFKYAIPGITATASAKSQDGEGLEALFDFDQNKMWHTEYGQKAVPFDLVLDLGAVYQLNMLQYLPRLGAGNGTWLNANVSYGNDREHWTDSGKWTLKRSDSVKVFQFAAGAAARYIKVSVDNAVGNFGSGRELYVFKAPGSVAALQGDVNSDGKIDEADLISYSNYIGLKKGDPDFEGYIEKGDINVNGVIDAYDVSAVATKLQGGVGNGPFGKAEGQLTLGGQKEVYEKGEQVDLVISGVNLKNINGLSFSLAYNPEDIEFLKVDPINMAAMDNLSVDRLHADGSKVLYPTFVNTGKKELLSGSKEIMVLRFRAKRKFNPGFKLGHTLLVGQGIGQLPVE